jgi:hypothetical protein
VTIFLSEGSAGVEVGVMGAEEEGATEGSLDEGC